MYGTENVSRRVSDGEVLGSTHVSQERRKLGGLSLGKSLSSEVGTEGELFDRISDYNILGKIEIC